MLKACGIAIIALAAVTVLRPQKSEFATMLSLLAGLMLLGGAAERFLPLLSEMLGLLENGAFSAYLDTLFRAMGITLCAHFASEICRDAGEHALAARLELFGKAELLVLAVPILSELCALAHAVMGGNV